MKIKLNGKQNWGTIMVPGNDFYPDTIDRIFREEVCERNSYNVETAVFDIVSTIPVAMDTGDYVIVNYTYTEDKGINLSSN